MSFLNSAKTLLDKWKGKPPPKSTQAIKQDSYDREVFDDILGMAPKVKQLVKDLGKEWDYAEDLMADVFTDLWQGDPLLHDKADVVENRRANHEVLQHFRNTPEREQLRPHTMHDEYGTAMAVVGTGSSLKETLKDKQEEKERAKQAQEQARQARENAQQAMQQLAQATQAAENNPTDTGCQLGLQTALEAAQAADAAATQTADQAQAATQELTDQLKQSINQAIKEQVKEREEEQSLCRSFGTGDGDLQRMSFEERAQLMQRLGQSRLAKFAVEIGRMRLALSGERMRRITQAREEAYSVELSGDLARVLPSELVKMVSPIPILRTRFTIDLAQRRLLSRKYRGKEKLGKGAIIAVVDCSGSMAMGISGGYVEDGAQMSCEAWAKAVCLSLLDSAMRQNRDMEVILFSSARQQQRFSFPAGRADIGTVIDMTEHFFGGGTEFETPLRMALELLVEKYNRDGKPKADIVFMTDDGGYVSEEFTHDWLAAKERLQFRTFGMAIGADTTTEGVLTTISDNVRSIADVTDPGVVADIFQAV